MNLIVYKQLVADYTNTSDHSKKKAFRKVIDEIKKAFRSELTKQDKKRIADVRGSIASKEVPLLFGGLNKKEKAELKKLRKKLDILEQERTYILNNQLYKDAFEWRFEFPTLLDENGNFKGFDLIIGNPPYQRIQGIREVNSAFADELVRKYKSATGSFDLYVTFAERGLSLINENGIVNYIMPTKWTNAAFGKGLRELVSKQCAAYKIINFGAYQVFNASTYTGLQWLKRNSTDLKYYELDRDLSTNRELDLYLKSLNAFNEAQISSYKLSKDSWVLTIGEVSKILNILEQQPRRVSDIFEKIFQGLATGKDDVYFLYDCVDENENVSGYSKQLRQFVKIERGLVKPLLKGEDVHRYEHIVTNRFVIFPYKIENGKAILYSEQELANSFPLGYAYLKQSEDVLRKREKGRFNIDGEWFQYSRKQGILFAEFEKLVAPDISVGGNFAYDAQGLFYQTTTVYGYIKKKEVKEDYKFWMALFNSRLFWWYLKNTGTVLANGFFRFKPDYIKPFPIPKAISSEANKIISTLCDYILTIKSQNFNISELLSNKLISEYFEKIIDGCIYEIYFGDYMKKLEIDIISSALTLIKSISNLSSDKERIEVILHTFLTIKKTDNPIRKRLELFTLRSPELLKVIIEG